MDKSIKKQAIRRLKITEGQIRGLQKMVEKEKYCIDIITQTSAIKQALSAVEDLILQNHLSTHAVQQIKSGKELKAIKEILSVYKLSKKK
jgi:CsoR family transcriptional regulator, copper-sensing transcriptional repressor